MEDMHGNRSGIAQMRRRPNEDEEEQIGRKQSRRYTPRQVQEMEALFQVCQHPDEQQRELLSAKLGLKPIQVKFWFQNRRTQMKVQQDRTDNAILRAENEKLRLENLALKEALKNVVCANCAGPSMMGDMAYKEQHLRLENARLKEEIKRMSAIASNCIGRPLAHLEATAEPSLLINSLDQGIGSHVRHAAYVSSGTMACPLADVGASSGVFMSSGKPPALEAAMKATEELILMAQTDEPLWVKTSDAMKEVLDSVEYTRRIPWGMGLKHTNLNTEATRDSAIVATKGAELVDCFMDVNKWIEMFPTIIIKAKTLQVLSPGMDGHRNGSLQMMHAELQVLSPLVSTRQIHFLRYCHQRAEGLWVVVDFSIDSSQDGSSMSLVHYRKLPSGCLIQDMLNGSSKVTWVEHAEAQDTMVHALYQPLVMNGMAFGAQRWLATLQRQCERFATISAFFHEPNADGRRNMMKLAQRMINNYCEIIRTSASHSSATSSGSNDDNVQITTRKSVELGQPNGVILCATTSVWLPVYPHRLFQFIRSEGMRLECDAFSGGSTVQHVSDIPYGSQPGNEICLLHVNVNNPSTSSPNSDLILQESCTDSSGSLIVYSPTDVQAIHTVMNGADPSSAGLLPSGFVILPDGSYDMEMVAMHEAASSSSNTYTGVRGSLLTIVYQVLCSNALPNKLSPEYYTAMNNRIYKKVLQIKAAFNCAEV